MVLLKNVNLLKEGAEQMYKINVKLTVNGKEATVQDIKARPYLRPGYIRNVGSVVTEAASRIYAGTVYQLLQQRFPVSKRHPRPSTVAGYKFDSDHPRGQLDNAYLSIFRGQPNKDAVYVKRGKTGMEIGTRVGYERGIIAGSPRKIAKARPLPFTDDKGRIIFTKKAIKVGRGRKFDFHKKAGQFVNSKKVLQHLSHMAIIFYDATGKAPTVEELMNLSGFTTHA